MLLAEDFVLLALHADGTPARGTSNQAATAVGVQGALVTQLVQEGHLDLEGGRIRTTGTVPEDPLLVAALENVARFEGKKLKNRLGQVKHAGWNEVVDAMVERGTLGREKHGVRPTRHPVTDAAAHEQLIAQVRSAATGDGPLGERTAALLALAGPCQLLEVVAPDRADRKVAKGRIAEATQQVPPADAVKYVIEATSVAASTAATVGGAA